ncbi:Hydroxymethylglutaryl-coenzyme A reductase [Coxiella endosymbiont of Amblyomma nuttalli]|nr:Hydroxymethylglutaryl-coenzyme A reductase [Coxiella endosymbiont of Amblyomma nuttalli]
MRDMKTIPVPVKSIGPIKIIGPEVKTEVTVPLATFETPIWPSTNRGASVTRRCRGLHCLILDDRMTRSILLEGSDANIVKTVLDDLLNDDNRAITAVASNTSRFCRNINWHTQVVGNLLFLRLEATTGDAAGHNMLTKAADAVIDWMLKKYHQLKYVSISGNICVDKKVSAINGILGRGKYVIADMMIPFKICQERLKTTPEAIVNLHIKKNLIGSIISGSLRTANAHFANLLYAVYLATGQDVANIVEGSQGFTHAELRNNGDLYFSVTLPNIIVGTVGNGKHYNFAKQYLELLGCLDNLEIGQNARRLAIIVAATVWCGELSLLAAQTNPGELIHAHEKFERTGNMLNKHFASSHPHHPMN